LNGLEKYNLEKQYMKHCVDVHEIDDTLTYAENMEHLRQIVPKSIEELASSPHAKSKFEWFQSLSLGELYGDVELPDEMPLLIIGCLVRYSQRMKSIVRLRLKPYRKHVDMAHRGYLIVKGQINEVCEILRRIEDVPNSVVRKWLVYDWERLQGKWQYIPSKGWVRKQDITQM